MPMSADQQLRDGRSRWRFGTKGE